MNQGDSYEFLFTEAGNYDYYCSIHPEMRGTVVVQEEAE
ncbi:MAG: plastocyanin/azurin family copper-binding protein [Methanosarcina flavescens]